MVALEQLVQNYKGGTCSFGQCGGANPAVTEAALKIISGEARVPERAEVKAPQVADARSPDLGKGGRA